MTKSSPDRDPDKGGADGQDGEGSEPERALAPGEWTAKSASSKSNQWLTYLNLGWLMVANMAVFTGVGLWADRHFGTAPVLLLIGVFLGFFGCGYTIYKAVKKIESDERPQPRG
jgi:F0F1-type ATP synthase assembly protein I